VDPDPGEDIDIGDGEFAATWACEPITVLKSDLQHAVQTLGLVQVTVDRVGELLWGEFVEMVQLPLHGADATVGKEDPLQRLAIVIGLGDGVETEFVVVVVMLLKVQQDGGSLEDNKVVAVGVNEHWDATVRVQLDEPRLLLNVLRDVDLLDFIVDARVGQLQLLKESSDLLAVGRRPGVELERLESRHE